MKTICNVCPHRCNLEEGQTGLCYARTVDKGQSKPIEQDESLECTTIPANYGQITSIALDPIEKKPLYHFHGGSQIISVGSYGCNLKCPFCQNVEISLSDNRSRTNVEYLSPEKLVSIAKEYVPYGNIGVAFTYNEPLICYEYVLDTSKLLKENGLYSVVVTNGSTYPWVVDKIGPYVDAMNIDLKSFSDEYYRKVLKGNLNNTKEFIRCALKYCHVELTTLVVSGKDDELSENVSVSDMERICSWIKDLEEEFDKKIPFHISRFFPRSQYMDRRPTDIDHMRELYSIASQELEYVYLGNC